MLKHTELTECRIRQALERLHAACTSDFRALGVEAATIPGEPLPWSVAEKMDYRPFRVGEAWGTYWSTWWFRCRGRVPAEWAEGEAIALFHCGFAAGEGFTSEALLWSGGLPRQAVNVNRMDLPINGAPGADFEFHLEAAANPSPNVHGSAPLLLPGSDAAPAFVLKRAELARFHREIWQAWCDMKACADALEVLPATSARRGQLRHALNEVADWIDWEGGACAARIRSQLTPLLQRRNGDTAHVVSAVGHAHIDTAWLWPLRETVRKCARTFSTALAYMKEYPDYVFACSQAVQYAWMKRHYPELFQDIRSAVARGQWEPIGSMWVEPDCNLPSGESLVRQIVHGKRFFRDELGVEMSNVWIPDVFGYSAALPQIFALSGVDSFLTQKISWNQFNKFPHHTFLWEGIDGTRIFTHFPPADTYNGNMHPREILRSAENFRDGDHASRSLYPYGFGDGGGGPTREMLEMARRFRDFEGLPRLELEGVARFFEKARADASDLPLWVGELYLESHRGTYTTQAWAKRGNRLVERALREAELADAFGCPGHDESVFAKIEPLAVYEAEPSHLPSLNQRQLDRAWKLLLTNQFHDIIPGSSIHWVYQDNRRDLRVAGEITDAVVASTLGPDLDTCDAGASVLNTQAFHRAEVVDLPDGTPAWVEAPACGWAPLEAGTRSSCPAVSAQCVNDLWILDNDLIRAEFNHCGLLIRMFDHEHQREVLAPGSPANLFQLHSDYPVNWDAWDIDVFHRESCHNLDGVAELSWQGQHPLQSRLRIVRKFAASRLEQSVVLRAGSRRLDFETTVDWHENHKVLKVAFPVNIRASHALHGIQFGCLERPNHFNTSWDMARFETCAHQWSCLHEGNYGVSVLEDCKYGRDVVGHVIRLTLLRAPTAPDPEADRGTHQFTFALYPHAGDHRKGCVPEEAARLNHPLRLFRKHAELPASASFLSIDRPGLLVSALKRADDGRGLIVRVYEAHGTRGPGRLRFGLPVSGAWECNLLEEDQKPLEIDQGILDCDWAPFQIRTLRIVPS
ncbi:MAG: alpha-mannosidase [Candidatus Methylacidiphilales bacterium]|nr:alpha-mannosidase [Candidatus Methylacidiphilales bacterium]